MSDERVTSIMHTGFTSLGTSTAQTLLGGAALVLPSTARCINAVEPQVSIDVPTVSQSVLPLLELDSIDVNLSPFQVLVSPINAVLGATVGALNLGNEVYEVNAPINGAVNLNARMTALVANTAAPTGGCSIVWSNWFDGRLQKKAKTGTLTSSGTTASSAVAGTRYQFTGANRVTELQAVFGHGTVAAADAIMGYFKYDSSEFVGTNSSYLGMNPIAGGLSTIFSTCSKVNRRKVNIPVKSGANTQVTIQDQFFMGLAPASAGNFMTGVIFE